MLYSEWGIYQLFQQDNNMNSNPLFASDKTHAFSRGCLDIDIIDLRIEIIGKIFSHIIEVGCHLRRLCLNRNISVYQF